MLNIDIRLESSYTDPDPFFMRQDLDPFKMGRIHITALLYFYEGSVRGDVGKDAGERGQGVLRPHAGDQKQVVVVSSVADPVHFDPDPRTDSNLKSKMFQLFFDN